MKTKILIIGGYGTVGSIITVYLLEYYPDRIIVGGRKFEKAEEFSRSLNQRITPLEIDVLIEPDPNVLENVGMVVMCIDQKNTRFVELCIEKGIHYIDITANHELIEKIEQLDAQARSANVNVVLSIGLAPGITNLLAQQCINQLPDNDYVDNFILLGLGEKHGDAAYRWIFDNINTSYKVSGQEKRVIIPGFSMPKQTELLGRRTFYSFNFSDQHTLAKTTRAENVITRLAFDSRFVTKSIALLRRVGFTQIFRNRNIQKVLIPVFKKTNIGLDLFAVKSAVGKTSKEKYHCSLSGNGEGHITAYVAIETLQYMLHHSVPYGVSHLHQVVTDIPGFLNGLKKYDHRIKVFIP